jgi:hypothetical protein
MDPAPAPGPAIFVIDLQDVNKKLVFCLLLFEGKFTSFFKDKKVIKKSQNSRNPGFPYYFYLMIEGSGSSGKRIREIQQHTDPDPDPQHCLIV